MLNLQHSCEPHPIISQARCGPRGLCVDISNLMAMFNKKFNLPKYFDEAWKTRLPRAIDEELQVT